MAVRHIVQRFSPQLDRRWVIGLVVVALLVFAASFVRWGGDMAPLELVALGPQGTFQDTVAIPASWSDTTRADDDVVARVPLVLGVRNPGTRSIRPERLLLSLPLRFRLDAPGEELEPSMDPSSPLVTYTLRPRLETLEPGRLPALLPAYDTLWLEVLIPSYYCVSLADSIPEFVAAPPPPVTSMADVRIFYSFEGEGLDQRFTGVLGVRLDTAMLDREMPPQLPSFPMETGVEVASPDLGALVYGGSRRTRCGSPDDPMEILSSIWEVPSGGRFITLDYGGEVRKHLYDLDDDGVIERESWDPDGDGVFEATRRAQLPIPPFLLPEAASRYDMARLDSLPPDSLASLDPFRRAMSGPGTLPAGDSAVIRQAQPAETVEDSLPEPVIRAPQPLGRPVQNTGGPPGGGR